MRALLSTVVGGPEALAVGERPDPVAGPGELVIDVAAASVNYPDVLIIEDRYQFKPPRPFAPGGEVAGTVSQVGEGVTGWSVGDRAMAVTGHGGMAEKVAVRAASAFGLPDGRSFEEGSALLLTYATTIHALQDRGELKAGETLLVLGASGGVGLAAVELGRALGARVIGAVSTEEKAAVVREAGADDVLIYGRGPLDRDAQKALSNTIKEAVGSGGADVIYDAVGGDYCEPALRSIAWEGRYLVIGFAAGIPKLPLNLTLLKSCDVRGVFWGAFAARSPDANRTNVAKLVEWWEAGTIAPKITGTYPLERGGEAIAALGDRSSVGKLVVTVGG